MFLSAPTLAICFIDSDPSAFAHRNRVRAAAMNGNEKAKLLLRHPQLRHGFEHVHPL